MAEPNPDDRIDFFVSYCRGDLTYARWIIAELEAAGFSTRAQFLDFPPGSNFILEMDVATRTADRTLFVLSSASLRSKFVQVEWAARLSEDPDGSQRKLIPVRVDDVDVPGLLRSVVYIDLVGRPEHTAREELLQGVRAAQGRVPRTSLLGDAPFPSVGPFTNSTHTRKLANLPVRRPGFSGRKLELDRIEGALGDPDSSRIVAVHGLGGVGKSRLVTEWAYLHSARYALVWWVRSRDDLSRKSDLAHLATRLGVASDDRDVNANAAAAIEWLETNDDWLVLFDDVCDPQSALEFLPTTGGGDVVVISRFGGDWTAIGAASVPLDIFSDEEAVAFLRARTGDGDDETARAISTGLGNLPLALEQAGSYVTALALSLSDYHERLRRFRPGLLERGQAVDHQETIATTWRMALDELGDDFPAEAILSICSYCAAEKLPRRLLDPSRSLGDIVPELAANPLSADDGLAALLRFSLLTIERDSVTMHLLVQEAARRYASSERADLWCAATEQLLLREFPSEPRRSEATEFARECMPHVLAVVEHTIDRGLASEATVELLRQLGAFSTWQLQTKDAAELLARAAALAEANGGHPQHLALTLDSLAQAQAESGQMPTAEATLRRSLSLLRTSAAPSVAIAQVLSHLGSVQRQRGNAHEARTTLTEALHLMEGNVAPDDDALIPLLVNLANATSGSSAAEVLLRRALSIAQAQAVVDQHLTATIKSNLSNLQRTADTRLTAVELAGDAVREAEESYGSDHPRLVPLLINLATSLYEAGDGAAAVPAAHRAVKIEEQVADKDGGQHASTLMVLARCEQRAGALRASRKTFLEAYRLAERSGAAALAANALSSAGDIARELDELATAERFLERALALQRTVGVEDTQYAMTLTRLGSVRRAQRRPADAATLHREASRLLLAQDPESSAAMDALNNLGNALGEIGEIAEAIDVLQRSYQIAMRLYGVGHPETWIIAVNLAMPLLWSGQESAAREVLAAAQGMDPDEIEVGFSAADD